MFLAVKIIRVNDDENLFRYEFEDSEDVVNYRNVPYILKYMDSMKTANILGGVDT